MAVAEVLAPHTLTLVILVTLHNFGPFKEIPS